MRSLRLLIPFLLYYVNQHLFHADFHIIFVFFHSSHHDLIFTSFGLSFFNEVIKVIKLNFAKMIPFRSILVANVSGIIFIFEFCYNDLFSLATSHLLIFY